MHILQPYCPIEASLFADRFLQVYQSCICSCSRKLDNFYSCCLLLKVANQRVGYIVKQAQEMQLICCQGHYWDLVTAWMWWKIIDFSSLLKQCDACLKCETFSQSRATWSNCSFILQYSGHCWYIVWLTIIRGKISWLHYKCNLWLALLQTVIGVMKRKMEITSKLFIPLITESVFQAHSWCTLTLIYLNDALCWSQWSLSWFP